MIVNCVVACHRENVKFLSRCNDSIWKLPANRLFSRGSTHVTWYSPDEAVGISLQPSPGINTTSAGIGSSIQIIHRLESSYFFTLRIYFGEERIGAAARTAVLPCGSAAVREHNGARAQA
jgi:hypothetical protein